jgi:hypothetical protein
MRSSVQVLRLTLYLACAFSLLSWVSARALYAQVQEAARALGRELADLPELTREAEVVHINGARMHHARAVVDGSVATVLDRVTNHCTKNGGPLTRALQEIARQHPAEYARHAPAAGLRQGVIRRDDERDGIVICLVGGGVTGLAGLVEAAQRFAETSDLAEFGHFRYVFAERQSEGKTLVVTLYSDSALDLNRMFPATGDAAGTDSDSVPRPPEARRTLSAAAEGMPYAVRTYVTRRRVPEIQRFYAERARERRWTLDAARDDEGARAYSTPEGRLVFISLLEDEDKTVVTLLEAGDASESAIATVEVE